MKRILLLLGATLLIMLSVAIASPQVAAAGDGLERTTWPSDNDPGPPYYARIEPSPPHVLHDGQWAAIVFYRQPSCVPAGFNLLSFFHFGPAFGCDLTVHGASLWPGEPFAGAPKIVTSQGNGAVPIWFVPVTAINQATQDGELTIGELAALDGLMVGSAEHFNEVLHPSALPPELGGGGHQNPKLIQDASGHLADGRAFHFHATKMGGEQVAIRIQFDE